MQNRTRSWGYCPIQGQRVVTLERTTIQEKTYFIKPADMVINFHSQNTLILRAGNCLVKNWCWKGTAEKFMNFKYWTRCKFKWFIIGHIWHLQLYYLPLTLSSLKCNADPGYSAVTRQNTMEQSMSKFFTWEMSCKHVFPSYI